VCIYLSIYICVYIHIHIHIYTYVYIYIYTFIYIYMYIYIPIPIYREAISEIVTSMRLPQSGRGRGGGGKGAPPLLMNRYGKVRFAHEHEQVRPRVSSF